jgi:uncharacterized protein YnzC (UPF0291/DUF896 family)
MSSILKTRLRQAKKRSLQSMLRLDKLSTKQEDLTSGEKVEIAKLRRSVMKNVQYKVRLRRRVAKLTGIGEIPSLHRQTFKRTSKAASIKRLHGEAAATAYLISLLSRG